MIDILLLCLGFVIIIKAADVLVDCASSLAIRCRIPKMLVALTIVSFGTCAPEIAISFQSIAQDNGTMAFANVLGSCIVNVFLIIGAACLIKPIKVQHATIKKELPILVIITSCFAILMLDSVFNPHRANVFSRADGMILLFIFFLFVLYLVQLLRRKASLNEQAEVKYASSLKAIVLLIISIFFITISSDLIVKHAISLAQSLHISEKIITMMAIVIGTSLPELIMTITSAKKGEFDMAIGNIVGTNIFNICIVLGLPVTIYGGITLSNFDLIDIIMVYLSSFILYLFAQSEKTISKREGFIMLLFFFFYYGYLFLQ